LGVARKIGQDIRSSQGEEKKQQQTCAEVDIRTSSRIRISRAERQAWQACEGSRKNSL